MRMLWLFVAMLAGCGGVAWDSRMADDPTARLQMVQSVLIGVTTETAYVTRWGPPVQKVREGARVDYIYRARERHLPFVIVTFDHGVAVAVRSSETEACRGTFPRRVPGYGFDRPDTVWPVGTCAGAGIGEVRAAGAPGVAADLYQPSGRGK